MLTNALAIKMIGVVVSAHFLRRGWNEINDTHHHHVATSHVTSPLVLLVWRVAMLAFTSSVLYVQVAARGPRAFRFFTVWNWTAIIVYFLLASIASAVSVFGGQSEGTGRRKTRSMAKPRLVFNSSAFALPPCRHSACRCSTDSPSHPSTFPFC
jgi:hypothetical protein